MPEAIAHVVDARHRREGVALACGKALLALRETRIGHRDRVWPTASTVAADLLVIGIGAVPVIELAQKAGLAIENGIAVDAAAAHLRPGHLRGRRLLLLPAWRSMAGAACGSNAGATHWIRARSPRATCWAREKAHSAVPWFWSDQYDLTLQIAGLPDEGTQTVRRDLAEDAFILFHLADDGRLVAASGIARGNAVAKDIRLAEMLIAKGAKPDPAALAQPEVKLKSLLAA